MNFARMNVFFASTLSSVWLLSMGLLASPALAGLINEPDPSLGSKANAAPVKTGVRYWIELKRRGQTSHVTNQERFVTGDQIRFHVQSTVDGYAYIVLRSGSQGEQAVLFPVEKSMDNNKLNRETDYALPADDYLTFDAHPGIEKVTLLFSKSALDPTKVMAATFKDSNHVVLSAPSHRATGSKDLIPARTTVTYQSEEALTRGDKSKASSYDSVNGAKPDQGMIDSVIAMSTATTGYKPSSLPSANQTAADLTLSKANSILKNTDMSSSQVQTASNAATTQPVAIASASGGAVSQLFGEGKEAAGDTINPPNFYSRGSSNSSNEDESKKSEVAHSSSNSQSAPDVSIKSATGAVIVRQDDAEKVLHIDVDLEHSGS